MARGFLYGTMGWGALPGLLLSGSLACFGASVDAEPAESEAELSAGWEALLADGDMATIAPRGPSPETPRAAPTSPGGGCPECAPQPTALWNLDDCNALGTELADTAYSGGASHPAFRAVSVACAPGVSGQGVRLAGPEDVVYAPDQPDFVFDGGLTLAAFINPDRVRGTQSIVRKRFDDSSSFVLAIEDRKLSFVARMSNGRLAGVSAPIESGRFTHVAATHDGEQLRLYLDGELAAHARARGRIKAGAGPIFIGNDADGRRFKGIIDEIWLDTSAADAETVRALTCIHAAPELRLSPSVSAPQVAGATVSYQLRITNHDDPACPGDLFDYRPSLPYGLLSDSYGSVIVGPGETVDVSIDVRSSKSATPGSFPFQVYVQEQGSNLAAAPAEATYAVETGPVSCDGSPPYTSALTGSSWSPAGGFVTYTAPGLQPAEVVALSSPDGVLEGLEVTANPGVPAQPEDSWFGVDLFLSNPACVDASAYEGVEFTVTGELGSCTLALELVTAQDNQVAFGGACTAGICYGPLSGPINAGTTFVRFTDMSGGVPVSSVDPTALQGIQWALNAPSDGVSEPCSAHFTISDVSFVAARPGD